MAIVRNASRPPRIPVCDALTAANRSEEHTSELQSHSDLVCRLLLEKKKVNDRLQNLNSKEVRMPNAETRRKSETRRPKDMLNLVIVPPPIRISGFGLLSDVVLRTSP